MHRSLCLWQTPYVMFFCSPSRPPCPLPFLFFLSSLLSVLPHPFHTSSLRPVLPLPFPSFLSPFRSSSPLPVLTLPLPLFISPTLSQIFPIIALSLPFLPLFSSPNSDVFHIPLFPWHPFSTSPFPSSNFFSSCSTPLLLCSSSYFCPSFPPFFPLSSGQYTILPLFCLSLCVLCNKRTK